MGRTTAGELAERLTRWVVDTLEVHQDAARGHLPGWQIPRTYAGHQVGADVRADVCFTLHHLAAAGVTEVAGERIDEVLCRLLAEVDGRSTHTFFSYRIAETLLRHGPFEGNPLLAQMTDGQRAEVALAVDSSDWLELLDAGVLPRNYAGVLARCELARVHLGLVTDTTRLDELVGRVGKVLGGNPRRALDDSNDRIGRYDIYTADVWLFTEPLADRVGSVWGDGLGKALDLVLAVGARDGSAIAWGRSTGDLAAALTIELAALALSEGRAGGQESVWLRRADDAARTLMAGFAADGVTTSHVRRGQDAYRGPERRLQLTFDLLGKAAWAAGALATVEPDLETASVRDAYPDGDRWIPFEDGRPAGVWAHRSPGADFVVPFVGTTRSHYLPALHHPGTWEVPVDRDLPTWTPLVVHGLKRYTAGGLPASVEHVDGRVTARWDSLPVSGRGLDGDDPGPDLNGTRTVDISVEGRTIVVSDHLTFERPPLAVSVAIPEVAERPLDVAWTSDAPHLDTIAPVAGLSEWRSSWSEIQSVHQIDLAPSTDVSFGVRVTPKLRVGTTELDHHYNRSLYGPMADRLVCRRTPIGWAAAPDPLGLALRSLDLLHMHWPEWVAFDDLDAHRRIIDHLHHEGLPVVWTAHNLTPHEKRAEAYDPIYQAWAEAADSVIHHSAWGEQLMRSRYGFRADCRHEVIPHGHFGRMWERAGLPERAEAERRLGLSPAGLRIGIVGAPRAEKRVQEVLDAVAACGRADVELVCWSLGPDDVVPADDRIAIAEPYAMVDRPVYATRLAACDVLALVFDADGEMLATGAAADAIGLGLPALRSDWGYLVEQLGDAGIPVGQTVDSIASRLDALTPEVLATARAAAAQRNVDLDWGPLAARTADLFERTVLRQP